MQFSGKNVLITGASKGIGAEIARTLAGFGLKVWINYRSKPEIANALKDEIESKGGMDASLEQLTATLKNANISYDELVINLQNTAKTQGYH